MEVVMPIVGYQEFLHKTKSLKPAVQQTLKPILEKVKNSSGADGTGMKIDKEAAPEKIPAKASKKPAASVVEDEEPPPNSFARAAAKKEQPKKKEDLNSSMNKNRMTNKVAAPSRKNAEEEDEFVI